MPLCVCLRCMPLCVCLRAPTDRAFLCWGCLCTVVYFKKGFEWFVVMYACTVAAVVLNSIRTARKSDIWPVRHTPSSSMSIYYVSLPLPASPPPPFLSSCCTPAQFFVQPSLVIHVPIARSAKLLCTLQHLVHRCCATGRSQQAGSTWADSSVFGCPRCSSARQARTCR
jgi:hypothetical protein